MIAAFLLVVALVVAVVVIYRKHIYVALQEKRVSMAVAKAKAAAARGDSYAQAAALEIKAKLDPMIAAAKAELAKK